MGAGCCSDEPTKDHGCAGPANGSDHGHEHDDNLMPDDCCAGDRACDDALEVNCLDENCDAETFCDSEDDSTCRSVKLECCTSKEEHCDGTRTPP